jgi:3-deoxy-D-manno-octulosonic acid (KDO) 8-phosphate synthase
MDVLTGRIVAPSGIAAGAFGAIVEVHCCPDGALCDGPQAVLPKNFVKLMEQIRQVAEIVSHRVTLWGREDVDPSRPVVGGWAT